MPQPMMMPPGQKNNQAKPAAYGTQHLHESLLPDRKKQKVGMFYQLLAGCQIACLVGFAMFVHPAHESFSTKTAEGVAANAQIYNYFIGVTIMMFLGFGYLMAVFRWYGLGAVGFTMLITVVGLQWAVLVEPLIAGGDALTADDGSGFSISMHGLICGQFAVAAVLISFGAIVGRTSPSQLLIMTLVETVCYCANKHWFLLNLPGFQDGGGTVIIHVFGAYFGLSVSYVLGSRDNMDREKASTVSDLWSMLGCLLLWIYWPSFVAGEIPGGTPAAEIALVNTVLSLCGSAVAVFIVSPYLSENIIRAVDIQNATLAGGVCIGATASINLPPAMAIFIGLCAGTWSCIGFCRISAYLEEKFGLGDACGINNLHGMPGIMGALFSAVIPAMGIVKASTVGAGSPLGLPSAQIMGVVGTMAVAITTGMATGKVIQGLGDKGLGADDSEYWEVPDDFGKEMK